MSLGFVVGESKPNIVTVQSSRALPIGEYVIIEVDEGKIVGLVETSFVTSAALSDVKNYDEAEESIELAELNKRDKSYTGKILILGFLEMLRKGKAILPAIPPLPGTRVIKATKTDLGEIFARLYSNKLIDIFSGEVFFLPRYEPGFKGLSFIKEISISFVLFSSRSS